MCTRRIAFIIKNKPLAVEINNSLSFALISGKVILTSKSPWLVFNDSLKAAIHDVEFDKRTETFRRLLEFGPEVVNTNSDNSGKGKLTLSDAECGRCVEFIHSHMVNRFKGELAELLSVKPVLQLAVKLFSKNDIKNLKLFWGDTIKEKVKIILRKKDQKVEWGGYSKGADGIIVKPVTKNSNTKLQILGLVEIKSKSLSLKRLQKQIDKHIIRLKGGLMLKDQEWLPNSLVVKPFIASANKSLLQIIAVPSDWPLSRKWRRIDRESSWLMVPQKKKKTESKTEYIKVNNAFWKIRLSWSEEAIEQAAYEMTLWCMTQVGAKVYTKGLPKGWEGMSPTKAGGNAIKMMLYYVLMRNLSQRQERIATKLYNIYCYGYPIGSKSKEMLWPEDINK